MYDSLFPFTPKELQFIPGCMPDLTILKMGDADLNVDLAACVVYNGAPLTPTVQATSVITVIDRYNFSTDVFTYSFMTLNG